MGGGLHILYVRESRVSLMARWCSSLFEVHMECSLQGVGFSTKGRGGRAYDKQCWLYLNLYLYWPQEVRRRKHVMMMRISFYNFETILQGKGETIWPSLLSSTFCGSRTLVP